MSWPAVKRAFTQEEFRAYVAGLAWPAWRPRMVVWHNTGAPTLAQWHQTAEQDVAAGRVPGTTRINNLETYFQHDQGWSGAPHLFIDDLHIWVFNPLTAPGVHSPSWNAFSFGFEMVGDFDKEDADTDAGLKVKKNCIFATSVLCAAIGIQDIRLHKEDPKTTHKDCPGRTMADDKQVMIDEVFGLFSGGEHGHDAVSVGIGAAPASSPAPARSGIVTANHLNFRRGPGVENESTGELMKGMPVVIVGEALNAGSGWLQVRTPAGYTGWVSGKYVK